jgi:uncharacterized protein YyaL (SSP411 family)
MSYILTGEPLYRDRADAMDQLFSTPEIDKLVGQTVMLCGFELLIQATQIVVVGNKENADTKALLNTIHNTSLPNKILLYLNPDQQLPANHPAHGKGLIDGKPTAYICVGPTCGLPLQNSAELTKALANS